MSNYLMSSFDVFKAINGIHAERAANPIEWDYFWEAAFEEFEVDELVFSENTFWFTFCQARQLMLMISKYCRKSMIDQLGDDLNNFFENL